MEWMVVIRPIQTHSLYRQTPFEKIIMSAKYKLLLSTVISTIAVTTLSTLGTLSPSQASNSNALETNMSAQILPTEVSQAAPESSSERRRVGIGKATYFLNEPAIQFDYAPNSFVLSSSGPVQPDFQPLLRSSTSLRSREDYLLIENAGDELGDFPVKLTLSVYSNPDGLPALDWITGRPGETLGVEIEGLEGRTGRTPDTTVAGRDAWTFSYRSLYEYDGIIFEASNGQMVMITAYRPPAKYALSDSNKAYSAARSTMIESMALTVSESVPESE